MRGREYKPLRRCITRAFFEPRSQNKFEPPIEHSAAQPQPNGRNAEDAEIAEINRRCCILESTLCALCALCVSKETAQPAQGSIVSKTDQTQDKTGRRTSVTGCCSEAAVAIQPLASAAANPSFETLEELIDDCLLIAKDLDQEGLDLVIRLLRKARNQVVWKARPNVL